MKRPKPPRRAFPAAPVPAALPPYPCVLCHAPAVVSGMYVPNDPALVGAPSPRPGKWPVFCYNLCRQCYARADKCAAVEAVLVAYAQRRAVSPWN